MPVANLRDLVTAYRKAKVDLFYSPDPRRMDLVAYEENLTANLGDLLDRIESPDEHWVAEPGFIGSFTFAPKKLGAPVDEGTSFWSVPSESWRELTRTQKPAAEFRLMSRCSIDLHVFSTLWMLKVGTQLDSRLSRKAMGNRLRRDRGGGADRLGTGSFRRYQTAYQRWRDRGLRAMADALNDGKEVIALTADVSSFYHRLDPIFLDDESFLSTVLEVDLTPQQRKLNRLFVAALHAWALSVASETGWHGRGLPVGLPASAVIANLALAELDEVVSNQVDPLYYGRYVDDILLVIEDPGGINGQQGLWQWLIAKSRGLLTLESLEIADGTTAATSRAIVFRPPYLERSFVAFENKKNKTFHLTGSSGMAMIESIRQNIQERQSEWRSLTNVPTDTGQITHALNPARKNDGDSALTLRDADRSSARKLRFSIQLRDCESFERNLPPDEWVEQRDEFFKVACEHLLALPSYFELAPFVPRLVGLAATCHDINSIKRVSDAIALLRTQLIETCQISVAAFLSAHDKSSTSEAARDLILDRWASDVINQIAETLASAWRRRITAEELKRAFASFRTLPLRYRELLPNVTNLRANHRRMAQRDLAHRPFRWTMLEFPVAENVEPVRCDPLPLEPALRAGLELLVDELRRRPGRSRKKLELPGYENAGLVFATRPLSSLELNKVLPPGDSRQYGLPDGATVMTILHAVRGYTRTPAAKVKVSQRHPTVVKVSNDRLRDEVSIALAMLDTSKKDAMAAANGTPNLSIGRFGVIRRLLDAVAHHPEHPDYLLLPELAMPASWFHEFARGLMRSNISLIAGIEHQPRGRDGVTNQVWVALCVDQFESFVYEQDKQRPAHLEKKLLEEVNKSLKPAQKWSLPPVIQHGDFRFAILICSELTNIANRAHLRGSIDALLIPEWNQDLHWFEALVESSALDLHSYIAQSNTRGFGDTRLRAPMENPWERDVVRLKGGSHDYFVVGQMKFKELRAFQLNPTTSETEEPKKPKSKKFKPLPDGFKIDPDR